ncbi:MAG: heavy metal sensor histidine kinase [Pseudoxanthomonas sp.]
MTPLHTRSIAKRLGLMFGLAATVVLSLLAVAIFLFQAHELQRHKRAELHARMTIIERLSHRATDAEDWGQFRQKLSDFTPDDGSLYFLSDSQDSRYRAGNDFLADATFHNGQDGYGEAVLSNGQRYMTYTHVMPPEGERPVVRLIVAAGLRELNAAEWLFAGGVLVLSVGAIGAVSALGWHIARRGLAPVDRLSVHARKLNARDLARRLPTDQLPEELEGLVSSLNDALSRLEQAYLQLSAFNADVAHELRTPLGNLIGETQVALSRARSADDLQGVLESNLEELDRLRNIVNSMLFLARADRGETAQDLVEVSLREESQRTVDFMEMLLEDADTQVEILGDARVCVERSLFTQALTNLLDNAVRHGEHGGTVYVRIDDGAATASVTVDSPGGPLTEHTLKHIFDRFYRADPARSNSTNSHGLGLAIVRAITQLHGGSVFVSSAAGRVLIGFQLPKGTPAPRVPVHHEEVAGTATASSSLPSPAV